MVKVKMCPATREAQAFDFLTALCNWRRHLQRTTSNWERKINGTNSRTYNVRLKNRRRQIIEMIINRAEKSTANDRMG